MFISVIGRFRWVQRTSLIMAIAALLSFGGSLFDRPVSALEGINERINFQGRLLNSQGATVPDGYYNVQFRIYQDGTGTAAGNPGGSLEWTESWLRSAGNGVLVRNGYFSVELGSVNPFASQVDWNQDTLYLSINIGDTNASCTPFTSCNGDGEMLPMKRLSSTPYALNAGKLGGRTADQFIQSTTTLQSGNIAVQSANAADSAAVIQGAASQTADIFQIRADGVASALMSVAANGATTLQPATDSATTLLVNNSVGDAVLSVDTDTKNVVLGADTSLTITGGATRPASPTAGMVFFDTATQQLLTYANGKWQADRSDAVLVAASNSSDADKAAADFVADGNTGAAADGDQVQINDALTAGAGKKVVLLAGTYTADETILVPNNTTFSGVGDGTVIQLADIDAADNLIENSDTSAGTGVVIRDMKLDGQRSLNTAGTQNGIYLNNLGNAAANRFGGTVSGITVSNFRFFGILATGTSALIDIKGNKATNNQTGINTDWNSTKLTISDNQSIGNTAYGFGISGTASTVDGNIARSNGADGFYVYNEYNIISNNISEANASYGFHSFGGSYLTFTGNIAKDNTNSGFQMFYDTGSSVTNNSLKGNGSDGIQLFVSTKNKVSGNYIHDSGGSTTNKGVRLTSADNNTITDNVITDTSCTTTCYAIDIDSSTSDNNYLSNNAFSTTSGTATIRDLGTGTRYANQSVTQNSLDTLYKQTNSASAFQIQNATGVAQLTANTTDGRIQIGSSTTDATAIVFALDNYNQATDPAGVNGAMYYNTDSNKFRCYENGAWADCIGAGAGTFADRDLSNLTATSINQSLIANADNTLDLGSAAIGWRSGYFGTAVYSPLFDTASAGALSIGTTNATSVAIGQSSITTTLSSDTINVGSATAETTVQKTAQTTADTAGAGLKIQGATGNGTGAGGVVTIQGGTGGATNANGGNVVLAGGTGTGTGVDGLVVIKTAAFSTTVNDANCYTGGALVAGNCTIALTSVNTSTGIIAGVSTDGSTVTLPDPTLLTAGRIVYITAANGSKDFKLIVNGGGTGNEIAMRQNSSATMLWNGSDWTAAGASSSTTLQNAYDNTLQSAGGAELVVSKTASTNGFTIRDSSINPVDGRLLVVQTSSAGDLISINSNVTEYASNAGAENAGATTVTFPANTWSAITGATVGRYATTGSYIAIGEGSVSVQTGTSTGSGVANQLTSALTAGTAYNVSLTTRIASGTFTDLQVQYSPDGTSSSPVACASDKVVNSSVWTKINCTFTAPASGITSSNAIFISQANAGPARTFYVDNLSVTIAADYNHATDGSVKNALGTNWTSVGGTTISRVTTTGYDGGDSVSVTTTGANQGVRNKLSIDPLPDTLYRVNVYANIASGTFDSFNVSYSRDGTGVSPVQCADYNTQTVAAGSAFTKISCYIQTDGTTATDPHVYFTQTDATGRTFYVDKFSMTLSTVTTPNVQIGGGSNGGPTTLFTLDRGASAPIASDNDALLGSMYYDTTLGKLQCYEADGWGACGSSPDNIITISPEYTNAVLNGTGIGTMTSDLCSDTLDINDGSVGQLDVCGTNETYNFYRWTSPQASAQTYSIYVTYQLPGTFKDFEPSTTSLMGRTDSTNSTVNYQIYRNTSTGLTACGSTVAVSTGAASSWQLGSATGASDPSACGFTAGDSIVFKINTTASANASAYVGNLNFTFSNR